MEEIRMYKSKLSLMDTEKAIKTVKDTFENKQLRDQVKNEYCYKNNIPLLRIPYWAYDSLTANDVILGVSPYLYEWEEPEKKEN